MSRTLIKRKAKYANEECWWDALYAPKLHAPALPRWEGFLTMVATWPGRFDLRRARWQQAEGEARWTSRRATLSDAAWSEERAVTCQTMCQTQGVRAMRNRAELEVRKCGKQDDRNSVPHKQCAVAHMTTPVASSKG